MRRIREQGRWPLPRYIFPAGYLAPEDGTTDLKVSKWTFHFYNTKWKTPLVRGTRGKRR